MTAENRPSPEQGYQDAYKRTLGHLGEQQGVLVLNPGNLEQPKGGMCTGCKSRYLDCSWFPFNLMPTVAVFGTAKVVRCVMFYPRDARPLP